MWRLVTGVTGWLRSVSCNELPINSLSGAGLLTSSRENIFLSIRMKISYTEYLSPQIYVPSLSRNVIYMTWLIFIIKTLSVSSSFSSVSYIQQPLFPPPCLPLIDLFHMRCILSNIFYLIFRRRGRNSTLINTFPKAHVGKRPTAAIDWWQRFGNGM
jgi:hypothetical protein